MPKRLSKTATIALGVGLISKGTETASRGHLKQGGMLVIIGIAIVYGYEVMQEVQVMELTGGVLDVGEEEDKGE